MVSQDAVRVLIVDDTEDSAHWLERLVRRMMGYQAVIAYSGADALQKIAAQSFDLVVMDWVMPGMDGVETLIKIRQQHNKQQIPVIILSANSDSKDISQVFKNGANDYIAKPVPSAVIIARIENQMEMKRLSVKREQQIEALKRANATRTELMRVASHDLKTPLHSLNLILSMLEPDVRGKRDGRQYLQMGYRHLATLQAIVQDFLETDLMNVEILPVDLQPVLIKDVVRDVVNDYGILAQKKKVTLLSEIYPGIVLADLKRLRQAISNLVSNAIKYTHPGTVVNLTGETVDSHFVLHVIDQGAGIPTEEASRLFYPYGKLGNAPTGGESSSGLGLWIVKQMMEAQGGSVGYNATYTDGAHFYIRVPLARTAAAV